MSQISVGPLPTFTYGRLDVNLGIAVLGYNKLPPCGVLIQRIPVARTSVSALARLSTANEPTLAGLHTDMCQWFDVQIKIETAEGSQVDGERAIAAGVH